MPERSSVTNLCSCCFGYMVAALALVILGLIALRRGRADTITLWHKMLFSHPIRGATPSHALEVRLEWKAQDMWIGCYADKRRHVSGQRYVDVWLCLLPCLPLHILYARDREHTPGKNAWKQTVGMFADDPLMHEILDEAMRIRDAGRPGRE